jgi:hypothetical protein
MLFPSASYSYTDILRPVTSVPPDINLAAQYDDAIMKQLITLSLENCVFLSVLSINKNTNMKVPVASETKAASHLFSPALSTIGETAT